MAHYAELNENNEVIYVIYMTNETITDENGNEVEQLGIDHLHKHHGKDRRWVRTSYRGNFRGRYAGVGFTYREDLDMFIEPQPYSSWVLNTSTGDWDPPVPYPEDDKNYVWNEEIQNWDIPPKPYPSWILNENTNNWFAPVPYPDPSYETLYEWNEETLTWTLVEQTT